MNAAVFWSIFGNLFAIIFSGGYAAYTYIRQGTHVRGIGWKSKKEYPKSYYFTLGVTFFIALISLVSMIFRLYTYYFV